MVVCDLEAAGEETVWNLTLEILELFLEQKRVVAETLVSAELRRV